MILSILPPPLEQNHTRNMRHCASLMNNHGSKLLHPPTRVLSPLLLLLTRIYFPKTLHPKPQPARKIFTDVQVLIPNLTIHPASSPSFSLSNNRILNSRSLRFPSCRSLSTHIHPPINNQQVAHHPQKLATRPHRSTYR